MTTFLDIFTPDLSKHLTPKQRSTMLMGVSKHIRDVIIKNDVPVAVKAKVGTNTQTIIHGLDRLSKRANVIALDLCANKIGDEGAGRLEAGLGQCASLAHLDLRGNRIGGEGAGRLAAGLGQCASLAHLDLDHNRIGAQGAGKLAAVLGQCASLANVNVCYNNIGAEGKALITVANPKCRVLF